jgi:hypothetical protein
MIQWRQRAAAARVLPGLFGILCGWAVVLSLAVLAGGVLLLRTEPDCRPFLERALTMLQSADSLPTRLILAGSAGLVLTWLAANLTLALMLLLPAYHQLRRCTAGLCYRVLQVGLLLFVAGQILLHSRGNQVDSTPWIWPTGFLLVLVGRAAGWLKDFGLALTVVVCAGAAVIDWSVLPGLVNWSTVRIDPSLTTTAWLCWVALVNLSLAVHAGLRFLYWQPR